MSLYVEICVFGVYTHVQQFLHEGLVGLLAFGKTLVQTIDTFVDFVSERLKGLGYVVDIEVVKGNRLCHIGYSELTVPAVAVRPYTPYEEWPNDAAVFCEEGFEVYYGTIIEGGTGT